ncbi:MAG: hypothetical protein OXT06_21605 [Rhodospirillaceae bacterium]|nr:hypothetical protein [Rhodospirillaceae bacterium]
MKFGELKSIGHNIAHSFASGVGHLIGLYGMDVFGEAAKSPEGFIQVDFLAGTSSGAQPSGSLAKASSLYAEALEQLCERHGTSVDAFYELNAYYASDWLGPQFIVTIQDQYGRRSKDEYRGWPGRRAKELDERGRIRPKRGQSTLESR